MDQNEIKQYLADIKYNLAQMVSVLGVVALRFKELGPEYHGRFIMVCEMYDALIDLHSEVSKLQDETKVPGHPDR